MQSYAYLGHGVYQRKLSLSLTVTDGHLYCIICIAYLGERVYDRKLAISLTVVRVARLA